MVMLSKPPYPLFNQFVLSLQNHEQMLTEQHEEAKRIVDHAQAFFGHRGRGRNNKGGRFYSRGRGFVQVNRSNNQHSNPLQKNLEKQDNRKSNNS